MSDEAIDLDAVINQLQSENERLRERLSKMINRPAWFALVDIFSWENIQAVFLNPFFIMGYLTAIALSFFCNFFVTSLFDF